MCGSLGPGLRGAADAPEASRRACRSAAERFPVSLLKQRNWTRASRNFKSRHATPMRRGTAGAEAPLMFTRRQAVADVVSSSPGRPGLPAPPHRPLLSRRADRQTSGPAAIARRRRAPPGARGCREGANRRRAGRKADHARGGGLHVVASPRAVAANPPARLGARDEGGSHAPGLLRLESRVSELTASLEGHLADEATRLFPLLSEGTLDEATQVLLEAAFADHIAVVAMLEGIRESADDFVAPEWACTSFRALYSQLAWLEHDVFSLIHLENSVLRPRLSAGAT